MAEDKADVSKVHCKELKTDVLKPPPISILPFFFQNCVYGQCRKVINTSSKQPD